VGNGAPRLKVEEAEGNRCSSRAMRNPPQFEV
jgi:hypothetical protein